MSDSKQRKVRSDKGLVMATPRDLYCIAWIAEQYAARTDQIRMLLSRFPDKDKPFKDGVLMAETTVKDQLDRWKRAGWMEYRRVLVGEPGYAWVTKRGLQLVDLDDIYTAREPASTRFNHLYVVNQVRLWMDEKCTWKSERRYRSEQTAQLTKGEELGPLPDGLVTIQDGSIVAIEVEISPKKPGEMSAKLVRLARKYEYRDTGYKPSFDFIWFYVPDEKIEDLIEAAAED